MAVNTKMFTELVAVCRWWHHLPTIHEWGGSKKEKGEKKSCKCVEHSPVLKANNYFVKELPAFLEN
jgi:bacterioferritin (cytochrome b1)